jgi:oligopeptidase A
MNAVTAPDLDLAHNPLLDFADLPRFDAIRPEHVEPAVQALLQAANVALEQVTAPGFPADWLALSKTLDVATERLGRAWGAVGHLNAVADTPELRAAYNAGLPKVTEFWTRLGADERLYAKYKAMDLARLTPSRPRRTATRCVDSCWAAPNCKAKPRRASPPFKSARPS